MKKSLFWLPPIFAVPALVLAQTAPVSTPSTAPGAKKLGNISIKYSPPGTMTYDDNTGIARATNDVRVTQMGEDFVLYCDQITYSRDKNTARGSGHLRVETKDSTLRGLNMFADFNEKVITIIGDVTISTHGENDGLPKPPASKTPAPTPKPGFRQRLTQKSSTLTCDRVDWDYELRQATITGKILMAQGDRTGTCDRILFDEAQNFVKLMGNARFVDKRQTTYADGVDIWVDDGKTQTVGKARIEYNPNDPEPAATPRPPKTGFTPPKVPEIPPDVQKDLDNAPPPLPKAPTPTTAP